MLFCVLCWYCGVLNVVSIVKVKFCVNKFVIWIVSCRNLINNCLKCVWWWLGLDKKLVSNKILFVILMSVYLSWKILMWMCVCIFVLVRWCNLVLILMNWFKSVSCLKLKWNWWCFCKINWWVRNWFFCWKVILKFELIKLNYSMVYFFEVYW